MKDNKQMRSLSTVAALLLLAVFAVGILSVLLGGAGAYNRLTRRDQMAFEGRSCTQYLATKVRQASGGDAVVVAPFGDTQALVITEVVDGEVYLTRIYCYEGWLMELYTGEGSFEPQDGEKLLPMAQLELQLEQGLLTAVFTEENGTVQTQQLWLRGAGEVQP